jgi:hypothetical protein
MLVALLALVLATTGTVTAAVLITSPTSSPTAS